MIKDNRKPDPRKKKRVAFKHAQAAQQIAINATLWRIIMQNAEAAEDYDPDKGATLTVPKEDFDGVPPDFGLSVSMLDDGNMIITATKPEPKSNLILPPSEIIT